MRRLKFTIFATILIMAYMTALLLVINRPRISAIFYSNKKENILINPDNLKELNFLNLDFTQVKQLVTNEQDILSDSALIPEEFIWKNRESRIRRESGLNVPIALQPKKCPKKPIIVMIKSALHHFKLRQTIRETWTKDLSSINATYFFTVGKTSPKFNSKQNNTEINNEIKNNQDMIVADIIDSYYNVTKKVVIGMNFVVKKCNFAEYVIHVDDDTYVSPYRFQQFIFSQIKRNDKDSKNDNNYIDCGANVHQDFSKRQVIRPGSRWGKQFPEWAIAKDKYSNEYWPAFCSGNCYGMPISTYKKAFNHSTNIDFTNIEKLDDVILTGIVRAQNKWKMYEVSDTFCWHVDNKKIGVGEKIKDWHQLGKNWDRFRW